MIVRLTVTFIWLSLGATIAVAARPYIPINQTGRGWVDYAFRYEVRVENEPTQVTASGLPAGFSFDAATRVITGNPTAEGTHYVGISATNADGAHEGTIAIHIAPTPNGPPEILNPSVIETFEQELSRGDIYGPWISVEATNWPGTTRIIGSPGFYDRDLGRVYYNNIAPGRYQTTFTATNPLGTGTKEVLWLVRPVVYGYTVNQREFYPGDTVRITYFFNSAVHVSGQPVATIASLNGYRREVPYASGSGTDMLVFTLPVTAHDVNGPDIWIGAIDLKGGTVAHESGVAARLDLPGETISFRPPVFRIYGPPVITSAATASGTVGSGFSYTITAKNYPNRYEALGLPSGLSLNAETGVISGVPTASGTFTVELRAYNGMVTEPGMGRLTLTISDSPTGRPIVTSQPASRAAAVGEAVTFTAATSSASPTYQWSHNGALLSGATASAYTISPVEPARAGIYAATITAGGQSTLTAPAILGVNSTVKVLGAGREVGANIVHPNGNVYDQVLSEGTAATVTADPGQVVRLSFVDLSENIVQVEFSGAGTLSLALDGASGPATAKNYNQPEVQYMRGHAGIVISGANETTHVSVFSVGRANAVNQSLFRDDVTYDGVADVAFLTILSANGKFGGLRAANASFWATRGLTGIYAPNVEFTGPVYLCDITATEEAQPVLQLGSASDVRVTGGDLAQTNHRAVQVSGFTTLRFANGATSHGATLPAMPIAGRLEENGADVTTRAVVQP